MTDKKPEAPIQVKGKPAEIPLQELKMSWAGKLFFAGVASWLGAAAYQGVKGARNAPKLPIKIRGTKQQIKAVMDALTSSKAFQDEIRKPGAKIEDVINKLKIKDLDKQSFERATGKRWPI